MTADLDWTDNYRQYVEVEVATLDAIFDKLQEERDSPVLAELGIESDAPLWSTHQIARLMRSLESRGYATYMPEFDGWVWPVTCPRCQSLRLSGHAPRPPASTTQRLRDPIPPRLRFAVMQRDGFRCGYCGRTAASGAVLHVDHIVPVSAGGTDDEGNLMTACDECNLGKGAHELP
jgi:5-methylcytosine-specific restriction endonuclease McrA